MLRGDMRLGGRRVLITGAGGILGTQFAEAVLSEGGKIVLAEVNRERLQELHRKLTVRYKEEDIIALVCDCSVEEDVVKTFAKAKLEFGGVDVVVNNATAPIKSSKEFFAKLTDFSLEEWRRQNSVNLDACFLVARESVRSFREKGDGSGGSLIQMSSIMGVMGHDKRIYKNALYEGDAINTPVAYSAAKAGVLGLMRWIAVEYADEKIRSNAIAPGGIFSGQNDEFVERYSARVPMGRMGRDTEITGALLYLASDESSYMTGQCLLVDGGLGAW